MTLQGERIVGKHAQPGGLAGNSDVFMSFATATVTSDATGDYIDMSNYTQFELIVFLTAVTGPPTRVAPQIFFASDSSGTGATQIQGEMEVNSGDLQANGRTPVCQVYDVDPDLPWVAIRMERTGGTNYTATGLLRGLDRKHGNGQRFVVEGTKVADSAASY